MKGKHSDYAHLDGTIVGISPQSWRLLAMSLEEPAPGSPSGAPAHAAAATGRRTGDAARLARIPLRGVLARTVRSSDVATNLDEAAARLRVALHDEQVQAILLEIDSPGGTLAGVPELAAAIRAGRARKPILAMIEGQAEGTAYWLASQAMRIAAVRSAWIGGIGLTFTVTDARRAFEARGIDVRIVTTGEHKGAGTPGAVVTRTQLRGFEALLEDAWSMFRKDLERARPQLGRHRGELYEGSRYLAERALELGLVDEVASRAEIERRASVATLRPAPSKEALNASAERRAVRQEARAAASTKSGGAVGAPSGSTRTGLGLAIPTRTPAAAAPSPSAALPRAIPAIAAGTTTTRIAPATPQVPPAAQPQPALTLASGTRELWENRGLAHRFEHDAGTRAAFVARLWSDPETRRAHTSREALEAYLLACAQRRCCTPF